MEHKLDLLNNSISFFREAVHYAQRAPDEPERWKFAIINLVQSMELALKESLRRIHPAFVYSNVDEADSEKTISIGKAIARLKSNHIGKLSISDSEAQQFKTAIKLRNQFVHFDCFYQAEHLEVKFANIFAFMLFFYEDHLDLSRQDIISQDQYSAIFSLKMAKKELLAKVRDQIATQNIRPVWLCPDCGEDTFVVEEEACRLCGLKEKLHECKVCGESIFEFDLIDISTLFESDYSEGRLNIYDDYGYSFSSNACPNCIDGVKNDISKKKYLNFMNEMEEEEYRLRQSE